MRRVPRHAGRPAIRAAGGIAAAVALGIGLVAMLHPSGAQAQIASQTDGTEVSQGAALFIQSCAACHGPQGQGTAVAPAIADRGAADVDFVLRTGRMPLAYPTQPMVRKPPVFGDAQIRALVAYVASLGAGPAIPSVTTTGADLAHGRSLFIENCAACHAATGVGDAVGGGFIAPSLDQADPLTVAEAMRSGPGAMPVFGPQVFPDRDVNDIAAYVQYLRSAPSPGGLALGGVGPVSEGFVAALIGLGLLLVVVRFIGRRRPQQAPGTSQRDHAADQPQASGPGGLAGDGAGVAGDAGGEGTPR